MVDEEEVQDLYKKGIDAYRRGELNRASDILMQVVEASEEDHRAWNALGVVFTKTGKCEDADVCFENALMLDPSNEIYQRNRQKNKSHIKKGIKDYFSSDTLSRAGKIPIPYMVGGVAAILILILFFAFVLPPILNPPPQSMTTRDIPIQIEQTDDLILITNSGSVEVDKVDRFQLTGNNQTIFSSDGLARILGTGKESTLAIPVEELYTVADNNAVTICITAYFLDGSSREVLSETLTLPVLIDEILTVTPVPVNYTPLYKNGDILSIKENGSYILVSDLLIDNQYLIEQLNRRNDGFFVIQPDSRKNVSMQVIDESTRKAAEIQTPAENEFKSGTPYQAVRRGSPPESVIPLYVPGDVISRASGAEGQVIVVLGYDTVTDEYAYDPLSRYTSGEWGYRPDLISEWGMRAEIEQMYPARITRIALSQIGIGATSSPPGTKPLYQEGDIVAMDRGADADLLLVLAYHPDTSQYVTDTIRRSYDGGWDRSGKNESVIRSELEREYPYKVRSVDVSLVETE